MLRGFKLDVEGHQADLERLMSALWKELAAMDRDAQMNAPFEAFRPARSILTPRSSIRGTITLLDQERFGT